MLALKDILLKLLFLIFLLYKCLILKNIITPSAKALIVSPVAFIPLEQMSTQ
jgi:hypothetical protein